jgi:hypothetical protein
MSKTFRGAKPSASGALTEMSQKIEELESRIEQLQAIVDGLTMGESMPSKPGAGTYVLECINDIPQWVAPTTCDA